MWSFNLKYLYKLLIISMVMVNGKKLIELITFRKEKGSDLQKRSGEIIQSFKENARQKRRFSEKVADSATKYGGSFAFLVVNVIWFTIWIVWNTQSSEPFDPFPFGLLTMIVSLEAIILAVLVLISQNRENKVNDLRSEIDARIDIVSEEKITKCLELLAVLLKEQGYDFSDDPGLIKMLEPENKEYLEQELEKQV